ncbi:hypothetical protein OG410_11350 [Streptomyces sp. NBC_00659]|uniref:hypothetical protein n=1 Tax=Streptomyces sp. NBC_00659 TaxID=2903669 RepID=UPI002E313BFD|nr:hypothetical protein [Streptomyces sp. NBC_00659]
MKELARAEGDLAIRRLILPWVHVAVAVTCASLSWVVPAEAVRPLAYAATLCLPLWGVAVSTRFGRSAWLHGLPEPAGSDGDHEDDEPEFTPGPTAHIWGMRFTFVVIGAIGAGMVALLPEAWIPWVLSALAVWALCEAIRQQRRLRRSRELCREAAGKPWHAEYLALMDERGRQLRDSQKSAP